ncbi:MAG TPA: 4-demethylwyosine synthase TYW1 [Candidatus Nanoarchaeia archaeon]|nr:4-demethylwyosine synthase TYW1 [Candidatus Nanoarchaeia archaeon]
MSLPLADQELQLTQGQIDTLEKQQYRLVGHHSAVKVCQWTKNMINGRGGCYKYKFYGIRSHQCMQMTTSMFCANRCTFCWRGEKAPVSKTWYGPTDPPEFIITEAVRKHLNLLMGFKGSPNANKFMIEKMKDVKHVALSLTGEPITYPLLNEILRQFHQRRVSTFLVTNAQFPEAMEKIENVTQLYISVDAPDKVSLKNIDRPLFKDYYERLLACLDIMAKKKFRRCVRLTVVKNHNDTNFEGYATLIKRGNPDFIEAKGYSHVGASQKFHKKEDMPTHEEVKVFAAKLLPHLPDYAIVDDHEPSCAVLFVKKTLGRRYINFPRFFDIVNGGGEAAAEDYSAEKMCEN